jgi:di/tricarboxylate transporter
VLAAGDRLVFAGPAAHLISLKNQPGLSKTLVNAFDDDNPLRHLAEVLVAPHCPLVGRPVGDGSFRRIYDGAVVAVARHGERVPARRWSDWILAPGDILLVEASDRFFERSRFSADFDLVTPREAQHPPKRQRAVLGILVLAGMVTAAALGWVSMFTAALGACGLLAVLRYIDRQVASEGLDLSVLLTIALSFSLGLALESSGAATSLVEALTRFAGDSPWTGLVVLVITTSLLTELITNNAAAALMIPLGLAMADRFGASHFPFVVAVMVSASASFATPIGYTTNLMVYGPGNYRFSDFLRIGIPMNVLVGIMSCLLIPRIWPF